MSGRVLLDTNIVIALLAREEPVLKRLEDAESVFVPSIVIGELFFGAERSARASENTARISEFAARSSVLACDSETARYYGRIKSQLREAGRPIPENDIWIAAQQHDLTLISRDTHFDEVGVGIGGMVVGARTDEDVQIIEEAVWRGR